MDDIVVEKERSMKDPSLLFAEKYPGASHFLFYGKGKTALAKTKLKEWSIALVRGKLPSGMNNVDDLFEAMCEIFPNLRK